MPKIKSAIKRVQITERNRLHNRSWRSAVRTVRSEVAEHIKAVDVKTANTSLQRAYSIIDRAVAKGALHLNTAARKKSRLAKQIVKLSTKSKRK